MRRAILKQLSKANELEEQRYTDAAADFIRIELELADTFCSLVLESRTGRQQHLFNARRALDVESLEKGGSTSPNC